MVPSALVAITSGKAAGGGQCDGRTPDAATLPRESKTVVGRRQGIHVPRQAADTAARLRDGGKNSNFVGPGSAVGARILVGALGPLH
eukprot:3575532-Alexandrium_andersonii.AAC.1